MNIEDFNKIQEDFKDLVKAVNEATIKEYKLRALQKKFYKLGFALFISDIEDEYGPLIHIWKIKRLKNRYVKP